MAKSENQKMSFGSVDRPIENISEDSFGLGSYVNALSQVIKNCDTPMTISIQGDWGSGKTSFMKLVFENLAKSNIKTVEFNTWQYSKFNMDDMLIVNLLNSLALGITSDKTKQEKIFKIAKRLSSSLINNFTSEKIGVNVTEIISEQVFGVADEIKNLKDTLNDTVSKEERVLIFIDDLDRLQPAKAIELLEVLQLFLTLDNCVFVLAVDYEVVVQGFKEKMGTNYSTYKSKNFFDKIIQLPFSIPTGLSSDEKSLTYVKNLLDKTNVANVEVTYTEEMLNQFINIISYSIQFNPRKLKRVMNGYWLLKLVIGEQKSADLPKEKVSIALFYVLCLQLAYEPIYDFVVSNYKNQESINLFLQYLAGDVDEQDSPIYREIQSLMKNISEFNDRDDEMIEVQIKSFMALFEDVFGSETDDENGEEVFNTKLLDYVLDLSLSTSNVTVTTKVAKEETMGQFVRRTIANFEIDPVELDMLMEKDYSKETFGINYPLLVKVTGLSDVERDEKRKVGNHYRYYKGVWTFGSDEFLLMGQWGPKHREKYDQWLEKFVKEEQDI